MTYLKAATLAALFISAQACAMNYDDARDQFSKDLYTVMGDTKVPAPFYDGATLEKVSIEGNIIVYKVVAKDFTYFPGNLYGPKREVIKDALTTSTRNALCKSPYTNVFPVILVMRFENGANPVSTHDSIMVNTKDVCQS